MPSHRAYRPLHWKSRGVLYFSVPNFAWAVDARTGQELWHFDWKNTGGSAIGNRGVAVFGETMYFETPDCNVVALNIHDGKERWHSPICNTEEMYFGSAPPIMIKNHLDRGSRRRRLRHPWIPAGSRSCYGQDAVALVCASQPGLWPEAATWPNVESMMHGGGMTWVSGNVRPRTQPVLLRNRQCATSREWTGLVSLEPIFIRPAYRVEPRHREACLVFSAPNPHDTHDWDAIETPVLIDGVIEGPKAQAGSAGKPQRLVLCA